MRLRFKTPTDPNSAFDEHMANLVAQVNTDLATLHFPLHDREKDTNGYYVRPVREANRHLGWLEVLAFFGTIATKRYLHGLMTSMGWTEATLVTEGAYCLVLNSTMITQLHNKAEEERRIALHALPSPEEHAILEQENALVQKFQAMAERAAVAESHVERLLQLVKLYSDGLDQMIAEDRRQADEDVITSTRHRTMRTLLYVLRADTKEE